MLFYSKVGLRIDIDIHPTEGRGNFYAVRVDKRCADNDQEIGVGKHGRGEANALARVEMVADDGVFFIVKIGNGVVGISGIVNNDSRSRQIPYSKNYYTGPKDQFRRTKDHGNS